MGKGQEGRKGWTEGKVEGKAVGKGGALRNEGRKELLNEGKK